MNMRWNLLIFSKPEISLLMWPIFWDYLSETHLLPVVPLNSFLELPPLAPSSRPLYNIVINLSHDVIPIGNVQVHPPPPSLFKISHSSTSSFIFDVSINSHPAHPPPQSCARMIPLVTDFLLRECPYPVTSVGMGDDSFPGERVDHPPTLPGCSQSPSASRQPAPMSWQSRVRSPAVAEDSVRRMFNFA